MNQIPLATIARKTRLGDRAIHRQLKDGAAAQIHGAIEGEQYPIEISGPGGTYTLTCEGRHSLEAILSYYDDINDRIARGHEEGVRSRLADIERQEQNLGTGGERAYQAEQALGLAARKTMDSEPPTYP